MSEIRIEFNGHTSGKEGASVFGGWRHAEKKNRRAVVFVHGLFGDPLQTWTAKDATSFPELIANDPVLADYDTFIFGFTTSYLNGPRIDLAARQLADELNSHLKDYSIILLGHSMGGVIAMRYVLDRLEHHDHLKITGLILYGSPTTGTDIINIARRVGFILQFTPLAPLSLGAKLFSFAFKRHQQIDQLGSASEFMEKLHDGWSYRVVNGGDPKLGEDGPGLGSQCE